MLCVTMLLLSMNESPVPHSIIIKPHRLGYLCVHINIDNIEYRFVIDSGSTNSYIDDKIIRKLRHNEIPKQTQSPSLSQVLRKIEYVHNTKAINIEGIIVNGEFTFYNYDLTQFNENIHPVSRKDTIDGILGLDILGKICAVINFKSMTITFVGVKRKLSLLPVEKKAFATAKQFDLKRPEVNMETRSPDHE